MFLQPRPAIDDFPVSAGPAYFGNQKATSGDLSSRPGSHYFQQIRPTIESQEFYTTPDQQSRHIIDDFSASPKPRQSQSAESERSISGSIQTRLSNVSGQLPVTDCC